jgi:hypothetical protein
MKMMMEILIRIQPNLPKNLKEVVMVTHHLRTHQVVEDHQKN